MSPLRHALLFATVSLSQSCHGPATTNAGPTQVARAFFDALNRAQWDSAVTLADCEWLFLYRDREVQLLETVAIARAEKTGAVFGAPRAEITADTFTARFLRAFGSRPLHGLRGVDTYSDLVRLSPHELLARCFEGIAEFERHNGAVNRATRQVIGQVLEKPDRAFVVFRRAEPGTDNADGEVSVLPLVKRRDRWGYALLPFFDNPDCGLIVGAGTQQPN